MKNLSSIFTEARSSSIAALLGTEAAVSQQTAATKRESLEHLLCVPIERAMNILPTALGDRLRHSAGALQVGHLARSAGVNTFGELLMLRAPALPLLRFAKEFGKKTAEHRHTYWHEEACKALYYASYAVGVVQLRLLLGELDKEVLQRGFDKLATQPWMPDELRTLFERASKELPALKASADSPEGS